MCLIRFGALTFVTPDPDTDTDPGPDPGPEEMAVRVPVEPRRKKVSQISVAVSNKVPLDSWAYIWLILDGFGDGDKASLRYTDKGTDRKKPGNMEIKTEIEIKINMDIKIEI